MTVAIAESNIAARFFATAAQMPDKVAVIEGERRLLFRELAELTTRYAQGLEAVGIRRGVRTVLMVTPGLDFFALTFALFAVGAVPVMVDPGMGVHHLGQCLREAEPEAFIGIPKAHVARRLFGWGKPTVRTCVTVGGPGWLFGGHSLKALPRSEAPFRMAETAPDETAAILFTSGSTGVPKGVVYTHATFAAQVDFLKHEFRIGPGDIDLPTFPLFALFDAVLGVTAVIPKMDFTRPASVDPAEVFGPIRQYGVTQMFGSPAVLNTVGRAGVAQGVQLPTLMRVVSAGAPVPPSVMERFSRLLPEGAEIFTPYGATEALPVASIGSHEILGDTAARWAQGEGTCVGRSVAGIELAIIGITDEPIAEWSEALRAEPGRVGEIAVKGANVTTSYYHRPASDALAKIRDPRDGAIWHRMGDLGRLDPQGRVWFVGRKAHRVETREGCYYPIPCEAIFNQHPRVYRSALVGVGEGESRRPVICVELEPGEPRHGSERLREELLEMGRAYAHTQGIETILFHPAFPVDIRHNAKIFREKLAVWAKEQLA